MDERPTILVVDDETHIAEAMDTWLTMAGYSVCVACKGSDAIEKAKQKPPAIAVVDLLLDDMPGLAVMNEIHRFSPDTECVVVTGQAPEESAQAATELSAYGYLMKPCDADQLLLLVRRALEHGRTKKALRESKAVVNDLMERIPEALMIVDEDLKIRWFNHRAANILGREAANLAGSRLSEHLPENSAAEVKRQLKAAVEAGAEFEVELEKMTVRLKANPLRDKRGEFARLAVAIDLV